jgi:hypothetical protein
MNFKSSDYAVVSANNSNDATRVLGATKRALARGLSVPLSFIFDGDKLSNGVLRGFDSQHSLSGGFFSASSGGHAVIITDFVNVGGREGALPEQELRSEINKGLDEFDYIKIKNSWGLNARTNESGVPVTGGSEGYYYMDSGYFRAAANVRHLSVVVPVDIARDPLSTNYVVDSRVTE